MDKKINVLKELEQNKLLNNEYKKELIEIRKELENKEKKKEKYTIYTDGGCLSNPNGPGGYGIVILKDDKKIKALNQGYKNTTNNRMELRGPLAALEEIKEPSEITIYSDSKYFTDAINQKWIENWLASNWKNGKVKNIDLWKQIVNQLEKHDITVIWVKGHNNNKYNEECDKLATKAYTNGSLIEDEGFTFL